MTIVMDDVHCNEDDKNISNCSARLMSHNCGHDEDIWLQCKGNFWGVSGVVTVYMAHNRKIGSSNIIGVNSLRILPG